MTAAGLLAACASAPGRPLGGGGFLGQANLAGTQLEASLPRAALERKELAPLLRMGILPVALCVRAEQRPVIFGGAAGAQARLILPNGIGVPALDGDSVAARMKGRGGQWDRERAWHDGMPADGTARWLFFDLASKDYEYHRGVVRRSDRDDLVDLVPQESLIEFFARVDGDDRRFRLGLRLGLHPEERSGERARKERSRDERRDGKKKGEKLL
jgi:hypothetical protein